MEEEESHGHHPACKRSEAFRPPAHTVEITCVIPAGRHCERRCVLDARRGDWNGARWLGGLPPTSTRGRHTFGGHAPLAVVHYSFHSWVPFRDGLSQTGLDYMFNGFPRTVQGVQDTITLKTLSTSNLSFLSNVVCAPAVITTIYNNPSLASLSGMIAHFYDPSQGLQVLGNPLEHLGCQALGPMLQCSGATSPFDPLFTWSGNF